MNDNLKLWDSVRSIDQRYTRAANVGGQNMLSVNGLAMVELFTAAFGPIGKNWTYSLRDERYENTRPMMRGNEPIIIDGAALWEQTHTVVIDFMINHGDEWQSFQCFGHTPYRYLTGSGKIMVDQEVGKKSTTDALKKALSLLGVAADVYSGALDDKDYAVQVQDQIEIKAADSNADKTSEMLEEMRVRLNAALEFLATDAEYAISAKTVKPALIWFSNRMASSNPSISRPATAAVSKIQAALDAKKQD